MRPADKFETMRTLHTLWRKNSMSVVEVRNILKRDFELELTAITLGEIKAESVDGKSKYSLK